MKFNTAKLSPSTVENLAGGESYLQEEKLHLLALLLTSFAEEKYYQSES